MWSKATVRAIDIKGREKLRKRKLLNFKHRYSKPGRNLSDRISEDKWSED